MGVRVSVGDTLEVLGAVAVVVASFLWLGWPLASLAAGAALVYFGQVYQDVSFRLRKPSVTLRRLVRPNDNRSVPQFVGPVFNCALCSGATPLGQPHRCET